MKKGNNAENKILFHEDFSSRNNNIPGLWFVESNSDLPQVPAIRYGESCIEFLSAGNTYLPKIASVKDFFLDASFKLKYPSAERFGILIAFRYDHVTAKGQYIGIHNFPDKPGEVVIEYGTTRANSYFPEETKILSVPVEKYDDIFSLKLEGMGNKLSGSFAGKKFSFTVKEGAGKIALARTHFFGILRLTEFSLEGIAAEKRKNILRKTIPLPDTQTHYPIFCDVSLYDEGDCMEADLSFHGGIADYPVGEGNYHTIRANILKEPFFKVITKENTQNNILHNKDIILVPDNLVPRYFFDELHEKPQWPFRRKVRFFKPAEKFDLAVGFGEYLENFSPNLVLKPAETVFDLTGKILYSGLGLTDGNIIKTEFLSGEKKKILSKIPKDDPRYDKAIYFAKKNHYFFEGENPRFTIALTSKNILPASFEITLEDAFFRIIRPLSFKMEEHSFRMGVWECMKLFLTIEELKDLPVGVWHIRIKSNDPSTEKLEKYCAFEIMGKSGNSPSPQEVSGLPFLYNARTETRGLMTDSFDPYIGESVNEGHYVSCCVFLPEAFRKYRIASILKAYRRKNFSWISTRTLDDASWEANKDIIRDSAFINFGFDSGGRGIMPNYATEISGYKGELLKVFIKFLRTRKDPAINIPALEKVYKEGGTLDRETYTIVAEKYWEEWLDVYNTEVSKSVRKLLKEIRTLNPDAMLASYGPFGIYANACKGPDAVRLMGREKMTPDMMGFWEYEDYPEACTYPLERGPYTHTSSLMAMKGSRIYPEVYSINKLKRGCPDGAVFYAHPPFGDVSDAYHPSGRKFIRTALQYIYGSAHISDKKFTYWEKRGFQTYNFPELWFERLLKVYGFILENQPSAPLRSPAYVAPGAEMKKKNHSPFIYKQGSRLVVRKTSLEDVPYLAEEAANAGICNGFQLFDEDILSLKKENVSVLVLPPLKGMKKALLDKVRTLHKEGVHLVTFEDAEGLEDLFGIKDTGKAKNITLVTATGEYCRGMTEYCDDARCIGRYKVTDAEILLKAEIPVLTRKKNGNAYAVFFNVPPHFIKENRLRARGSHGKIGISPLVSRVCGQVMRVLSSSGISIREGRLLACHTKNGKLLLILSNPHEDKSLSMEVAINRTDDFIPFFDTLPESDREFMLVKKSRNSRTYRILIPEGEFTYLLFSKTGKKK